MDRYSYSFSFVPRENTPGGYMFYMTANRWVGKNCVASETIFSRELKSVTEVHDPSMILPQGIEMADIAYQVVSEEWSKVNNARVQEVNTRPASASTN